MKKIIAFTSIDDFHTSAVKNQLIQMGSDLVALERESYGEKWVISSLSDSNKSEIYFEFNNEVIPISQIGAIWNRRDFTINYSEKESNAEVDYINTQKAILVNSLLKYLDERIPSMNRIQSNWYANSKYLQSEKARNRGLLIPNTFQGGSPTLASDFLKINKDTRVCIKALEAIHLKKDNASYAHYTSIFKPRPQEELQSIRSCPIVLQQFIEKEYEIRATVVGDKVFSASIDTSNASETAKIDWRHYDWANTPYFSIDLPENINNALIQINKDLNLVYGAYDLIKTANNNYFFLEVNPQGQWLWIEDLTGMPISGAIANWLLNSATDHDY